MNTIVASNNQFQINNRQLYRNRKSQCVPSTHMWIYLIRKKLFLHFIRVVYFCFEKLVFQLRLLNGHWTNSKTHFSILLFERQVTSPGDFKMYIFFEYLSSMIYYSKICFFLFFKSEFSISNIKRCIRRPARCGMYRNIEYQNIMHLYKKKVHRCM